MKLFGIIITIFIAQSCFGQQPCGNFEYENYLGDKFPGFKKALELTRQESLNGMGRFHKNGNDTVYMIPVVFHIVWNTPEQNIHDSLIFSQIKALNEAYRHKHKDTGRVRDIFKPVAGDTKIEFFLATKDPEGKPTSGINRVNTTRADFGEFNGLAEAVKSVSGDGVDAWNTGKYLNIWVCKFTFSGLVIVSAYAFPPTNAQFWNSMNFVSSDLQGVVVNYQFVGVKNPNDQVPSSLKERTMVHEVGHFLGLRHIWADKRNTCIGQDDGLDDTPLCNAATTSCPSVKNTCNQGTGDKPDMIENYMDYSPYPCTVMFTKQQSDLMRFNLLTLRPQLAQLKVIRPKPVNFEKIAVFPNPVRGDLTIQFETAGLYKITLMDMIGQKVISNEFEIRDSFEHKFDTRNLSPGVYHLSLSLNNSVVHKQKLIVD